MSKVTAVDIKGLWYAPLSVVTGKLTASMLKSILEDSKTKQITNVHQDTWAIEEEDPSVTRYRNQLTNGVYRETREMGAVQMSFTIGQYSYEEKAAFIGGEATETSWARARGVTNIEYCMIALTADEQYCVFPKGAVTGRNAQADGAIGIGVAVTALEPDNAAISAEYWYSKSEVYPGA